MRCVTETIRTSFFLYSAVSAFCIFDDFVAVPGALLLSLLLCFGTLCLLLLLLLLFLSPRFVGTFVCFSSHLVLVLFSLILCLELCANYGRKSKERLGTSLISRGAWLQ